MSETKTDARVIGSPLSLLQTTKVKVIIIIKEGEYGMGNFN